MPRGRRNNYNYYYPQRSLAVGKRNKYSTMTYIISNGDPLGAGYKPYFTIVPPTEVGGMRKVKNITIQLSYDGKLNESFSDNRILWAIVYVPKGSEPGDFNEGNGILYSPPQFIMASGIYDTDQPGNGSRIFTPLSRNLNSGDGIAFVYKPLNPIIENQITTVINYAITLQ
jgi:hypothetical protein